MRPKTQHLFLRTCLTLGFFLIYPESGAKPVASSVGAPTKTHQDNGSKTVKKEVESKEESELIEAVPEETLEEKLIKNNILISEWVDTQADALDLFLAGRKLTSRRNTTSVRIENSTFIQERENVNNTTSLNVNLRLPNVEKYWQLKFTTYDEMEENRNVKNSYVRKAPREQNYGATVGLFHKLGNVRTAFQPRIELQDPLKVSHSLIFESVAELKTYRVNPKIEFYANSTKGVGVFQALNFNFQLNKVFSLTFVNEGDYEERRHQITVTNGLSLGQRFNSKQSLAYNIFFESNNRPHYHLESYSLSVSWYEVLYKKILDYQITPHLGFSRESSFTGSPGLTISFFINF